MMNGEHSLPDVAPLDVRGSKTITIRTGARLHFGLLAHRPDSGRLFGGAGVMIDAPGFELTAESADSNVIEGPPAHAQYAERCVTRYLENTPPENHPPAFRLAIRNSIEQHVGLGSGTQLALSVARVMASLAGDIADPSALARRVGRGKRSALGVGGFFQGGLLIDAGKVSRNELGTLVARHDFPNPWRFLLVTPATARGLSGDAEQSAFEQLPGMPAALTDRLCRILLMELLPAVIESRFEECSEALFQYGRHVGEYFAPVQGGSYANPQMSQLVDQLRRRGIRGVGQTSWGPTIFVLCDGQEGAEGLRNDLARHALCGECELQVVRPMNTGAFCSIDHRTSS